MNLQNVRLTKHKIPTSLNYKIIYFNRDLKGTFQLIQILYRYSRGTIKSKNHKFLFNDITPIQSITKYP